MFKKRQVHIMLKTGFIYIFSIGTSQTIFMLSERSFFDNLFVLLSIVIDWRILDLKCLKSKVKEYMTNTNKI